MYRMDLPYVLEKIKAARDALPKGDATMDTRAHLIVAQEIVAQAISSDRGLNFVTAERLLRFPLLIKDAERIDELQDAAHCDIKEGSEWLPWYKMSLNSLVISAAAFMNAAQAKEGSPAYVGETDRGGKFFYDHMLLCGIGPLQDNPDKVARAKHVADQWLEHFKKGTL